MDEKQFDAVVNLEDVIDNPDALSRAFNAAAHESEERLWGDPEWTELRWTHRKDIVRAFLVGTINADAWFHGYTVPPNLEVVCNALCGAISFKFSTFQQRAEGSIERDECVFVSLLDIEAFFREFIAETPLCKEWNDFPGSGFVSRYDATSTGRTFIDLDALVRNAAIHIRADRRDFDRFNAEFEAKHGKVANGTD